MVISFSCGSFKLLPLRGKEIERALDTGYRCCYNGKKLPATSFPKKAEAAVYDLLLKKKKKRKEIRVLVTRSETYDFPITSSGAVSGKTRKNASVLN